MIAWNFRTYDHEALLGLLGSQDTVNPSTFQPFNFQPFNPSIVELRLAVVPSRLQYLVPELRMAWSQHPLIPSRLQYPVPELQAVVVPAAPVILLLRLCQTQYLFARLWQKRRDQKRSLQPFNPSTLQHFNHLARRCWSSLLPPWNRPARARKQHVLVEGPRSLLLEEGPR